MTTGIMMTQRIYLNSSCPRFLIALRQILEKIEKIKVTGCRSSSPVAVD